MGKRWAAAVVVALVVEAALVVVEAPAVVAPEPAAAMVAVALAVTTAVITRDHSTVVPSRSRVGLLFPARHTRIRRKSNCSDASSKPTAISQEPTLA